MEGFFKGGELPVIQHSSLIPKCGACGLFKTCNSPKMEPTGNGRRRFLIVAEAPGEEEDKKGIQLVGKSGQLLQNTLRKIGVDMRRDCHLTNAVICRPPDNNLKKYEQAVDYCRANLLKTISKLKPDVIILLGAMSVASLIPHAWGSNDIGGISRWAGWRIPSQKLNAWICPTYHPAHLLRQENPVLDGYFERHLIQAFKLTDKPFDEVPDYASQVQVMLNHKEVAAYLDQIRDGVIAFDYETNMLKPESDKAEIVSCSVCVNGLETIAFPWHGRVIPAMQRLLSDSNVGKVASNMKFEDRWTRRILRVPVRNWLWDTMLAAHMLDCRRGITSIKFLSFVHLGQPRYDTAIEPYLESKDKGGNTPNRIKEIPLNKLLVYNGLDSLLEYAVAFPQSRNMKHPTHEEL